MQRTVSIAELKARLSEYVSAARGGDEIMITRRGRPVARLAPLAPSGERKGRVAELARAGLIREPKSRLTRAFLSMPRPSDRAGRSLEHVLEERAEGW